MTGMSPALRLRVRIGTLVILLILLGANLVTMGCRSARQPAPMVSVESTPTPCALDGIENAYRLGPGLWSGGEPHGDAAFRALAAAGVRTVVSVDGAKPDLATAHRHGLRYVHVPIGYDGLSEDAVAALAALTATPPYGGVFVHCHHGKHRGPTAAAIMARAAGAWDASRAEAWQRTAGTSGDYSGLYRAVRDFQMPDQATLRMAARGLRPTVPPAGLVESMVLIDGQTEALADMKAAGWKPVATAPDETPARTARLLEEQFAEGVRLGLGPKDPEFRRAMEAAEQSAAALRVALEGSDGMAAERAWKQVREGCTRCHRAWRNHR